MLKTIFLVSKILGLICSLVFLGYWFYFNPTTFALIGLPLALCSIASKQKQKRKLILFPVPR